MTSPGREFLQLQISFIEYFKQGEKHICFFSQNFSHYEGLFWVI